MPLAEFPKIRQQIGPLLARMMDDPALSGLCMSVEPSKGTPDRNDLVVTLAMSVQHMLTVVIPWQLEHHPAGTIWQRCKTDLDHALVLLKTKVAEAQVIAQQAQPQQPQPGGNGA